MSAVFFDFDKFYDKIKIKMKIINPSRIKKADLIIGIPSHNESKGIGFVVKEISNGLKKYFSGKKSVIVNVDNNSIDGTKEIFLKSSSDLTAKNISFIYCSTPKDIRGKGYNLRNLFKIIKNFKAVAGATFDADLKSITPLWVKKLISPVLSKRYDFVFPYYARLENDAVITNHLVYPFVYGFLNLDIRQPIGGEFAFSGKLANDFLNLNWNKTDYQFGVDIFLGLSSYFLGAKICQVNLGKKIHKSSLPNLNCMFNQVTESLLDVILRNKSKIKLTGKIQNIPILRGGKLPQVSDIKPNFEIYEKMFFGGIKNHERDIDMLPSQIARRISDMCVKRKMKIDGKLWSEIMYYLMAKPVLSGSSPKVSMDFLRCLFFGRVGTFFEETLNFAPSQTERAIRDEAEMVLKLFSAKRKTQSVKLKRKA